MPDVISAHSGGGYGDDVSDSRARDERFPVPAANFEPADCTRLRRTRRRVVVVPRGASAVTRNRCADEQRERARRR